MPQVNRIVGRPFSQRRGILVFIDEKMTMKVKVEKYMRFMAVTFLFYRYFSVSAAASPAQTSPRELFADKLPIPRAQLSPARM